MSRELECYYLQWLPFVAVAGHREDDDSGRERLRALVPIKTGRRQGSTSNLVTPLARILGIARTHVERLGAPVPIGTDHTQGSTNNPLTGLARILRSAPAEAWPNLGAAFQPE